MARILIVDDEPEIVLLTRMMLEREGYEVVTAKDSTECFEKLNAKRPDLVLLDVMMPGDNGWEVCRKIKEDGKTRSITVAMFTVRTSDDSIEKSLKCADAHIGKPFAMQELLDTVDRLLKKAGPS